MEFVSTLLIFLVLIGILVFIHELGHFLAAKWTGMRADVFSLGMGPRVIGWNHKTGLTVGKLPDGLELNGRTDYRLSALPIGGYVTIVGMIDESLDTDFVGKPPQPWEFRSKNALQKAFVLAAGVLMNILLAIVLFTGLEMSVGHMVPLTTTVGGVEPGGLMDRAGIRVGDRIVAVNAVPSESWETIVEGIVEASDGVDLLIESQGLRRTVHLSGRDLAAGLEADLGLGVLPQGTNIAVGAVTADMPAAAAGMQNGDVVLAVDSVPVKAFTVLTSYLKRHRNAPVVVHINRNDTVLAKRMTVTADGTIGFQPTFTYTGPERYVSHSLPKAVSIALDRVWSTVRLIVTSVTNMVQGKASFKDSVGGPVAIAKMAAKSADLGIDKFITFMALISVSLAVMNLLPLPGLDGGHLVFVLIEAVARRELPANVKIRIQQVGIAMLLIFMAVVLYIDIVIRR